MINLKKYSLLALGYFFLIALLGVLLRSFSVSNFNFNYKYVVHTHSHIALLGWVYTALMILIYKLYLNNISISKKFKRLFWVTQITISGMLLSFPFTGYAFFSILFSTLFLVASYAFCHMVFKHTPLKMKQTNSYKCVQIGLWYMVISSLGPLALGIIMSTMGSASSWYRNAIYFYLHFQYNGWFIMALFGILFYTLKQNNIQVSNNTFKRFFVLMNIGVVLTLAISILWMKVHTYINNIAGIGALFQILAFGFLVKRIITLNHQIKHSFSKNYLSILKIVLIFFSIKLLLQFTGTLPSISSTIASNIHLIIGYLHWIFLGVCSFLLLGFLNYFKFIQLTKGCLNFYILGFLLMEFVILYNGIAIWKNLYLPEKQPYFILACSVIFLFALMYIFLLQFNTKKINKLKKT